MKLKQYFCWFLFLLFLSTGCLEKRKMLKPRLLYLNGIEDIVPLSDSLVDPILYQDIPNLENGNISTSKRNFIAIVLPAILVARHKIAQDSERIKRLAEAEIWSAQDSAFYKKLQRRFRAENIDNLLLRMRTHPNSIVLAQAAVESGWGSSHFFRQANNLFGIWAYTANEPRVPAAHANVYLRKYNDVSESIEDYFVTLGRARPYRSFREARGQTNKVEELLPHLKHYSERGYAYTNQLKLIIDQNNLTQYDHYQIDPGYFLEY